MPKCPNRNPISVCHNNVILQAGLLVLFLFLSFSPSEASEKPEKVLTGIFLTNVNDLSHSKKELSAIFWIWFKHSKHIDFPVKSFEIVNAKETSILTETQKSLPDGDVLTSYKIRALVTEKWDLTNFPFDFHQLEIIIESAGRSSKKIQFIQDCQDSIILDQTLRDSLDGWHVEHYDVPATEFKYPSSFGHTVEGEYDSFSRIVPTLYIKRIWQPYFFNLFFVLYFSFLISALTLLLPNKRLGSKVTFISISIATIIVSKFVVDAYLSSSNGGNLYSSLEMFTLWTIFAIVLFDIIKLLSDTEPFTKTVRFSIFSLFCVAYTLVNIYFISDRYLHYRDAFQDIKTSCSNNLVKKSISH